MEGQKFVDTSKRRREILAIVILIIGVLSGIGGIVLLGFAAKMESIALGIIALILFGVIGAVFTVFAVIALTSPQSTSMPTSKGYQMEAPPPPSLSASKVYQIEELPLGTRCMVSHLEIHLEMDELVACPYCERIAKKELLEEWLEENYTCPVCQRTLRIEECPIVQIKETDRERNRKDQ